jgi:peptidoglycan/LPS O-acetylase OafA/YrhL
MHSPKPLRNVTVQHLRALAVVAVILFHANLLESGFIGVDVFFVISGFVITKQLYSNNEMNLVPFIRNFMSARIRRLLPALSTVLIATFVLLSTLIFFN